MHKQTLSVRPSGTNQLNNAQFHHYEKGGDLDHMPWWDWSANKASLAITWPSDASLFSDQATVTVSVPAGSAATLKPTGLPPLKGRDAAFGVFVKTSAARAVYLSMAGAGGVQASSFAPASSSDWHHVGLRVVHNGSPTKPTIHMSNIGGVDPLVVSLTGPSFSLASVTPTAGTGCLSRSGGVINGVVTSDSFSVHLDGADAVKRLEVPQVANIFVVENSGSIARLNDRTTANHTRFK